MKGYPAGACKDLVLNKSAFEAAPLHGSTSLGLSLQTPAEIVYAVANTTFRM